MKKTKLKFSAMSVAYVQYSLDYVIESYRKLGLKSIEFWAGCPHFYKADYASKSESLKVLEQIREKLKKNGITVSMYTTETLGYPFSYSHPDEKVRKRTLEHMKDACDEALAIGCNRVFVNTGCGLRDLPKEESFQRTADTYKELCSYAKNLGVDIVLEQLQPYESNLVISLEDCIEMKRLVGYDNFKICLDVVAMEVAGENIQQYFDAFGDDVVHIHLADRNHEILGNQDYPLENYLKYLEEINYKEYISLEINDSIYWIDPHGSLEKSKEWLAAHGYDY